MRILGKQNALLSRHVLSPWRHVSILTFKFLYSTCVYCPAGSMCPVTNSLPQICPLGTYQDEIGKTYCKTCPDGYTCTSLSAAPVACTDKEYTDMFHQACKVSSEYLSNDYRHVLLGMIVQLRSMKRLPSVRLATTLQ